MLIIIMMLISIDTVYTGKFSFTSSKFGDSHFHHFDETKFDKMLKRHLF